MAFPLMVHLNSSRRALAPNLFLPMVCIEVFIDVILLCVLVLTAYALANAAILHPNFRILSISTIFHYAIGVLARFVIIYYELNDLPVARNDWLIFGADIVRDHMVGWFISLLGVISFERCIATRHWEWYESRARGTLWIAVIAELLGSGPTLVNVILCEYDYYPHEVNFVVFGLIVFGSVILYLIAYKDNTRVLRSLNVFGSQYTVNRAFQFTAICLSSTIPFVMLSFFFFGVFFFAPVSWERERYICVALVDFCITIFAPVFFFTAIRSMREYRHDVFNTRECKFMGTLCAFKFSKGSGEMKVPSKTYETEAYFEDLTRAWA